MCIFLGGGAYKIDGLSIGNKLVGGLSLGTPQLYEGASALEYCSLLTVYMCLCFS